MKITDGKFYATSREGIQNMVDGKNADIEKLAKRLKIISVWADKTMDLHIPYVSGRIDISISSAENRKANFLDQLKRNLWCSECSSQWPCTKIDELKQIRDYASGYDVTGFPETVDKIAPKKQRGQFPEVCL